MHTPSTQSWCCPITCTRSGDLPAGDSDFSTRWRLIRTASQDALPKQEALSAVRIARNERGIWQRRFWEHLIRDEATTRATSSIVISTRSSTASSRACAIGRIPRFIATFAQEYSRLIGQATVKQGGDFGERE
jgi:putative transposase